MKIATRLDGVSESATLKLNAAVQALKAKGETIYNLSAGEPDFAPPEEAKAAIRTALDANRSKYTPVPGIPELRLAIAEKTNRQQPGLSTDSNDSSDDKRWKPANVVVSNGGKQAIYNAFQCLINPGDEVIVPAPYWLSYPEMVKLAGGVSVIAPTRMEEGFKLTPETLRRLITPKTKLVIFNSPSNPTGAVYSLAEFQALARVLVDHPHVYVMSDEIYDRIVFDVPFVSFLAAAPELRDRTVTVNGLSKSGAMTGWRVGWSVAPSALTNAMITLQGQSTSGINALAQWASVAALGIRDDKFLTTLATYRRRRDLTLEVLSKAATLKVRAPDGAFYVFVHVGQSYAGLGVQDAIAFAERLLDAKRVAVVPGTPFGAPEFVRISFATDDETLREGCKRLADFVSA